MILHFDTDAMTRMLIDLLNTPSPTGYHQEIIPRCEEHFAMLGIPDLRMRRTNKGALLLTWPGDLNTTALALTAHVDTLGLMVKGIKSDGTLTLTALGGINWPGIEFENCTIRTYTDRRYRGTVMLEDPSTHVNRNAQRAERSIDTLIVRLDERTTSKAETKALGIEVGDFIFLDPRVELVDSGFLRSRFLDDKASVAGIWGALQAMQAAGQRPAYDTHILISNYEEVGHGGSAGIPDAVSELVAVDMAAIGSTQTSDEFSVTICVKDGGGPYHFDLNNKLRRIASEYEIPHNIDIYVYYSSDGSAYWRAGGDAKVALIGPGVSGSHGYERMHQDALNHSAHLIARYLLDAQPA